MNLLMIDNYDSFTFNIVQYFGELGARVSTLRRPSRANSATPRCSSNRAMARLMAPWVTLSSSAIRHFAGKVPILGVCLGHQAIGEALGGRIVRAGRQMHGKTSVITTDQKGVFAGLPRQFTVNRYHSLVIERATCPPELEITAASDDDGEIMAVRHKTLPIEGVQFHPESVLTEHGHAMLRNFLEQPAG